MHQINQKRMRKAIREAVAREAREDDIEALTDSVYLAVGPFIKIAENTARIQERDRLRHS